MKQWRKGGRPSVGNRKSKPWTKEELSIICATEKASAVMLAIAVVRQWIADGKPKKGYEGVKPWLDVIRESYIRKNINNLQRIEL